MFRTPGEHNRHRVSFLRPLVGIRTTYGRALNESSWVNRGKKDAYDLEGLTLHQVKPIEREAVIKQERGRLSHAEVRDACVYSAIF